MRITFIEGFVEERASSNATALAMGMGMGIVAKFSLNSLKKKKKTSNQYKTRKRGIYITLYKNYLH
jgi:hypothetical protein